MSWFSLLILLIIIGGVLKDIVQFIRFGRKYKIRWGRIAFVLILAFFIFVPRFSRPNEHPGLTLDVNDIQQLNIYR